MASVLVGDESKGIEVFEQLRRFLDARGAKLAPEQPGMTVAGAITDLFWVTLTMSTGDKLNLSFDGFVGTTLEGDDQVVRELVALFHEAPNDA